MGEEDMLSLATERFERRLAQEIASLERRVRQEMHDGFTAIRKELSDCRVEWLRWSFGVWVTQLAATAGLIAYMLRAR